LRTSNIRELQGFVAGVERDKAAVVAGLTRPQNNGLVEGKINKLKLMKRMGYGRAGFASSVNEFSMLFRDSRAENRSRSDLT
jgi:transposase